MPFALSVGWLHAKREKSISYAPNNDHCDSGSSLATVKAKNTRHNRRVSLELPYWSSDGSLKLDTTAGFLCALWSNTRGIIHGNTGGFCQKGWKEAMNAEKAARFIRANEESQATPRAQEYAHMHRVLSGELVSREDISGGSMHDNYVRDH